MKQFLFTALSLCAAAVCLAQDRLEIKIFGCPTFSDWMITGDKELREALNNVYEPLFRYETGALITVKRLSRMDFETGLVLSRKGVSLGEISYRDVNNDPAGSLEVNLNADFLEVPFRLNYYFSKARRNYLVAGISMDFLITSKYTYEVNGNIPDDYEEEPPPMRTFNTGLQIGYGYRLVNSESFGLDVEPNFKIQLLDAHRTNGAVAMHFYSIGLSCKFRLKV